MLSVHSKSFNKIQIIGMILTGIFIIGFCFTLNSASDKKKKKKSDTAATNQVIETSTNEKNSDSYDIPIKPLEEREQLKGTVKEFEPVLFELDKAVVRAEYKKLLDEIGKELKEDKIHDLFIHGYTDDSGTDEYNRKLSTKRAVNVASYLINKGYIPEIRVVYDGFGETRPVADNASEENRQKNRRVELILIER